VKKLLPSAFDRTWCVRMYLRSYAGSRLERKSSQPASHAFALAGPGGYLRSNVEYTVERMHITALERRAYVRTQARDLSAHLVL
jgi:hypothetical protein